jgi:hypothetical protein
MSCDHNLALGTCPECDDYGRSPDRQKDEGPIGGLRSGDAQTACYACSPEAANDPCKVRHSCEPDALDNLDMAGAHIRVALAFTEGKLLARGASVTATNDLNAALDYIEKHRGQRRRSEAAKTCPCCGAQV